MTREVNEIRFKILGDMAVQHQNWVGRNPVNFIRNCLDDENDIQKIFPQLSNLKNSFYNRVEIKEFIQDNRNDSLLCCYLIFSWGGMHLRHARSLLKSTNPFIEIIDLIRQNGISIDDSYDYFYKLQNAGITKGLGPAFYTKLLYFFGQQYNWNAFIMDQWTSLSINFLFDQNIVKMNSSKKKVGKSFSVAKENDYMVYKNFNECIKNLADLLSQRFGMLVTPETAEIMIFSEGRGLGEWRNFLVTHYTDFK